MSAAGVLLEIAVKTSIVLCVALVATHLMARRAAGAARHVVWASRWPPRSACPSSCWSVRRGGSPRFRDWATGVRAVVGSSIAGPRADADVWPVTPSSGSHAPMVAEPGRRAKP